jgi:signal peptidase I
VLYPGGVRVLDRATSRLPHPLRVLIDWTVTIAVAAAIVLLVETEVAKPFRIPSASMERTLHCARPADGCRASLSDRVVACRLCYLLGSPSRGQIVVFRTPPAAAQRCGLGGTYVKRLVGMPGETVHEDAGGFIWIDGKRLSEPYITADARAGDTDRDRTWQVPDGSYFMLGDNRGGSCDSRMWGAVPREDLIGPVVLRYWPPDRVGPVG